MKPLRLSNFGLVKALAKSYLNLPLSETERFFADMYASELAHFFSKGKLIPVYDLAGDEIQVAYNFLGTQGMKHKIYCVSSIHRDFNDNLLNVRDELYKIDPKIKVSFQQFVSPFPYSASDKNFVRQYANSTRSYKMLEKMFDSFTDEEKVRGKHVGSTLITEATLLSRKYEYDSFTYISEISKTGKLGLSFIFLHIFLPVVQEDNDSTKVKTEHKEDPEASIETTLETYLVKNGVTVTEVRDLVSYLNNFSPLSVPNPKDKFSDINAILMPYTHFGDHIDTMQGMEGQGGIHYGILANNVTPLTLNHKLSPSAQIEMFLGKTGSGKSDLSKGVIEEHIWAGDYLDINDFKGTEYTPLQAMYPNLVKVLNLDKGVYPNVWDISNIPYADTDTKYMALEFATENILALINFSAEEAEKYLKDMEQIVSKLASMYYTFRGVTDNPSSFVNSSICDYHDFWEYAKRILLTSPTFSEEYPEVIKTFKKTMEEYFGYEATKSNYFRTKINLPSILNAQVVIYSFNMLHKKGTDLKTRLGMIAMNNISLIRNNIIKRNNDMQVIVYEEVQEAKGDVAYLRSIAKKCTLSRSANNTIRIILNNIEVFAKTGNNLIDEATSSILASITSWFIGYIEKGNLNFLKTVASIEEIIPIIEKINDTKNGSAFKYHFAFKYNTGDKQGHGMMCQHLPPKFRDNPLYTTRDTKDKNA